MNIPGIVIYVEDYEKCSDILSPKQKAELLDALVAYGKTGQMYAGKSKIVHLAFRFVVSSIQRTNEKYQKRCAANRSNADKRWKNENCPDAGNQDNSSSNKDECEGMPADANECESMPANANECHYSEIEMETETETNTETQNTKPNKRKRESFIPPTQEEVACYCREKGYSIDANHFIDYYTARGWELGKGRKMKDWHAAVNTWAHNGKEWNRNEIRRTRSSDQDREQRTLYGL